MIYDMSTATKGRQGEDFAAAFLAKRGYKLVYRNFRYREGEIDIIVEKDNYLVFVEVKTWDTFSIAELEYVIRGVKKKRLFNTARYFLGQQPGLSNRELRFDLLFISKNFSRVEHIENAFSEV